MGKEPIKKDVRQTFRLRPVDQERLAKLRADMDRDAPAVDHNDTVIVWTALYDACVARGLEAAPAPPGDVP